MFKKVLITAVLAVSSFGVIAANAATPGVYVTGQLGYVNTHIKSKLAANEGPAYKKDLEKALDNNGLAGRIAVGYQFNQNFALELGYLQLKKTSYLEHAASYPRWMYKLNQNAIDLAAKGILPITDNLNAYGKLGVAYLTTDYSATYTDGGVEQLDTNIALHRWAPEAAVGVSYDITPNVSIDTSWTHIQPVGKNLPGSIDFVAVGLGYSFG